MAGGVRTQGLITAHPSSRLERALGPYNALRGNRAFSLLFVAQTLSAFIDWLYLVALFILAYDLTHDATVVALLTFTRLVPYAVLLPVSGVVTDRFDRKLLMSVALVGRAVAMFALTAVQTEAGLPYAFVLVVAAATLSSVFRPALLASVPDVVPERDLLRANSVLGQVDMAAYGGGPAIAGFLLLVSSARVALLVAGVGLLVAAAAVSAVTLPARAVPTQDALGGVSGIAAGLRYLYGGRRRLLLGIAVAWAGLTLWGGAYWALSIDLARVAFHIGDAGVGFINASYAVGGLLGGFIAAGTVSKLRPTAVFIGGAAASSIAEALFGLGTVALLPFIFFFLTGLADALAKITATTAIQTATPRYLLGRVFGAFESLFILSMAIGALIAGPLISSLGPRVACALIALIGLGLLVVALPLLLRLDQVVGIRMFLSEVPVLNLLPLELMEDVETRLRLERHDTGSEIVREGEHGDRMYLIKCGRVEVTVTRDGQQVPIASLGRADYFGEIALLEDTPRTATCRCLGDVEVYALLREDFQDVLDSAEEFGEALRLESAARRLASWTYVFSPV